jgi:hypothetical protein
MNAKGLLKKGKLEQIKYANSPLAKSLYFKPEQCYLTSSLNEPVFTFAVISAC